MADTSRSPDVLVVSHTAQMGGAEYSLLAVMRLDPRRFRVLLMEAGPFENALLREGIETVVIPLGRDAAAFKRKGGLYDAVRGVAATLAIVPRVARRARSCKVLHLNTQKGGVIGSLAAVLSRRPAIWHLRTVLDDHHAGISRRATVTLINHVCRYAVAPTQATADAFVRAGGKSDKVRVIPNGFDPSVYVADREARGRIRAELGLEDRTRVVGCFSRLTSWKGQHVLLEALSAHPELRLIMVGDAIFDGDASYAEVLRDRASRPDLKGRVHFLGYRNDIPALLSAVDVVAVPSVESEAFGRVVVEAQLTGVPVVATSAGGPTELIVHQRTGLLVPPGDAVALGAAIDYLSSGSDDVAALVRHANRDALDRFDVHQVGRRLLDLLDTAAV